MCPASNSAPFIRLGKGWATHETVCLQDQLPACPFGLQVLSAASGSPAGILCKVTTLLKVEWSGHSWELAQIYQCQLQHAETNISSFKEYHAQVHSISLTPKGISF